MRRHPVGRGCGDRQVPQVVFAKPFRWYRPESISMGNVSAISSVGLFCVMIR